MTDTPTATAVVVTPAPRISWRDLIPLAALMLTIVGLIVAGGKILAKVEDNGRRIVQLEQRADRRDDEQSDIKASIAAMDAKLDLLIRRTSTER